MSLILEVKNFSSRLKKDGKPIFESISFGLASGDRLILTGESGAGKSLLLRSIVFLEPLSAGQVWFQGHQIFPNQTPSFRNRVIYMPQRPTLIEGTVEQNLKLAYQFENNSKKKYEENWVKKTLDFFGLPPSFLLKPAKALSGGEAQIVALIRAWMLDPQVIILDEPTASLDPRKISIFETSLVDWVKSNQDKAFIWVTHQSDQGKRVGNRTCQLDKGYLKFH